MTSARPRAWLALEDGAVFGGRAFGHPGETTGEVVFNTALAGYQEVLTDPSYAGQIVTMTYPHIGNYGINLDDVESVKPQVAGFVVRELSGIASSWRSTGDLEKYLADGGVAGISEVDTRALTRHLRTNGAMRGIISTQGQDVAALLAKARGSRSMIGADLVRDVTCPAPYEYDAPSMANPYRVVAYDFGMKTNILRLMQEVGCAVTVVPATTTAAEVLKLDPEGVFLSNGPGDPEALTYAIESTKALIDSRKPVFGICLGHQIMGLACGGKTFKLKFGHRGANHPVKNLKTGQIEVTSQNHGFSLDPAIFERPEFELTHTNLNDGTVEGFRHRELPAVSVQYHPEASPGPHDSHYLFDDFITMMASRRKDG